MTNISTIGQVMLSDPPTKKDYLNLSFVNSDPFFKNLSQRQINLLNFCYFSYRKTSISEFSFDFILENQNFIIRNIESWNIEFDFTDEEFEKGYNNYLNENSMMFYFRIWYLSKEKINYDELKEKIFISLLNHLFCKYTIPKHLNFCWFFKNDIERNLSKILFFKLAKGDSLFKILKNKEINSVKNNIKYEFPELTKNQCKIFIRILENSNEFNYISINDNNYVLQLLFTTIICSLTNQKFFIGGLFTCIKNSFLNNDDIYKNNQWFIISCSVIKWIISLENEFKYDGKFYFHYFNNKLSPILDYFGFNYKNNEFYSLKGRTYDSIQKAIKIWHKQLKLEQYSKHLQIWNHSNINNYELQESENKIYTITEILSTEELYEEGHELNHCVLSYIERIHSEKIENKCTIWSLKENNKRLVTIQINSKNCILQICGYRNRMANTKEVFILNKWIEKEKLRNNVFNITTSINPSGEIVL